MNSWRPYPLLRLVFPFVAGIVAEGYFGSSGDRRWLLPAMLSVLVILPMILQQAPGTYRWRWIPGIAFNCFLLIAGYEIASLHRPANKPDFLGKKPDGLFIATVAEPPANSNSGIRVVLDVRLRMESGSWKNVCGKAIGYLKTKPGSAVLYYGDHLLLRAGFSEIKDNSNPHTFNYSRYLNNKGISHQVFAGMHGWRLINLGASGIILRMAFQIRDRLLNILRQNHVEGKEFAVAAALLLGYVDDLDPELCNDYAATGAMHILSVSGMHVGIIYIFLEFILGFLNRNRLGRMAKALLLLVFIWFYAMITGLSPCVLRSAAMLSLPIIGKSLNRSPDMYNIIAASMLFILAMDPFLISDVGFQLSYLAVTGIILLYKPVYDLYVTSSWLPDKIWSILAVSIAAQVATLPITLYTFHRFPNYFMLTNIFVVPLSSLIIYTGILVLFSATIPVISMLCAKMLIAMIWALNSIIHLIEQLPCSTISDIYISAGEMALLYLFIASVFLFLTLRRISFLYLILLSAILWNLLILEFKIHRFQSSGIAVFNDDRTALYMFSVQDKAVLFYGGAARAGTEMTEKSRAMASAYMIANGILHHRDFWLLKGDRPVEIAHGFVPVLKFENFIQFSGHRIAMLRSAIPKGFNKHLDVDLLIVSGNPKISIAEALRVFHPAEMIIDGTNSRFKTLRWMKEAAISGVHCHAVTESGAFHKEF